MSAPCTKASCGSLIGVCDPNRPSPRGSALRRLRRGAHRARHRGSLVHRRAAAASSCCRTRRASSSRASPGRAKPPRARSPETAARGRARPADRLRRHRLRPLARPLHAGLDHRRAARHRPRARPRGAIAEGKDPDQEPGYARRLCDFMAHTDLELQDDRLPRVRREPDARAQEQPRLPSEGRGRDARRFQQFATRRATAMEQAILRLRQAPATPGAVGSSFWPTGSRSSRRCARRTAA